MNWQYLRQGKGQDVRIFTQEFRKQALNLGIALDTLEVVTKYIGSLHSYIRNSLFFFKPTNIDSASVKVIHIENRGKMKEMIIPKNHRSNLSMTNLKRNGKERRRKQRKPKKENDLIAITAKRKATMMIIVGNNTQKSVQRSMEEKGSKRQWKRCMKTLDRIWEMKC